MNPSKFLRRQIVYIIIFLYLLLIVVPKAYAIDWDGTSISSGYAVTTDWHGEPVPLGETVTAYAGTTNPDIVEVRFRWLRPNKTVAWDITTTIHHTDTWNGETVYVFIDTQIPDELDDWGVQAIFYNDPGTGHGPFEDKIAIRARSFFSVPEVPLGTIVILAAMFGALTLFVIKRRHSFQIKSS